MPKRSKKLIVYLDQNFISEMAKAGSNKCIKPEFYQIYELLHQGFLDEKLVVPASWFHDVETSLSIELKDKIISYQNYLGQVRLNFPSGVQRNQIMAFASMFKGSSDKDPLSIDIAFGDNPDKRTRMLNVVVDQNLQHFDFKSGRSKTAQALEKLRQRLLDSNTSFDDQYEVEIGDHRRFFLTENYQYLMYLFNEEEHIFDFIRSEMFKNIPVISISAKLWACLLTKFKNRPIKSSDSTDIDIISTYLPYVDVLATDAFIADRITELGIASRYKTIVFDARTQKLRLFITYLEDYLKSSKPVHVPAISIFVLPDTTIKDNSFELFYSLGTTSNAHFDGNEEWADIYGFDDGHMPRYRLKHGPELEVPFYGLQNVHVIKIRPGLTDEEVIKICYENRDPRSF